MREDKRKRTLKYTVNLEFLTVKKNIYKSTTNFLFPEFVFMKEHAEQKLIIKGSKKKTDPKLYCVLCSSEDRR